MSEMPINRRAKCPDCGTYLEADGRCPRCVGRTFVDRNRAKVFSALAWIMGLERPEKFNARSFFGKIFARHDESERTEVLNRGYLKTIPPISEISTDWPSPWMFARFFGFTLLVSILLHFGIDRCAQAGYGHVFLILTSIFVDSALIPLSVLVFYYEMNARKSVSMGLLGSLFLIGGAASLCITLFLGPVLGSLFKLDWMGASVAGIIEEPAKLLAVLVFAKAVRRHPYILDGLVMGAAVGAGFAAFESCGYTFWIFTESFVRSVGSASGGAFEHHLLAAYESSKGITLMRAWVAPFGHVTWTAIAAAAFFLVKGSGRFRFAMLLDTRFVRIFVISVALHMFWNSLMFSDAGTNQLLIKVVICAILELMVLFTLIAYGLKQLKTEKEYLSGRPWEREDGMDWVPSVRAAADSASRSESESEAASPVAPSGDAPRRGKLRKTAIVACWIIGVLAFGVFCEYQSQEYRNRIVDPAGRFTIRRFANCDCRVVNEQGTEFVMAVPSVQGEVTPEVRIMVQRGVMSLTEYVDKNVREIEAAGGVIGLRASNTGDGTAEMELAVKFNGVDTCAYCLIQQVIGGFYVCRGSAPAAVWRNYRDSIVKSVKSFKVDKQKGMLK